MTNSNKDGRRARIEDAVRKGRCDRSEGVPSKANPYHDEALREAWQVGWVSIMRAAEPEYIEPARELA